MGVIQLPVTSATTCDGRSINGQGMLFDRQLHSFHLPCYFIATLQQIFYPQQSDRHSTEIPVCPRQRCCVLSSPGAPWKQVHSSARSPWKQVYSSSFSCHPASVTSCSGQSVPLSAEKQTASVLAGPPLDSFRPPSSPHVATAAVHQ